MKTAKIKIVEGGTAPFKKHPTDSCWDLTARKIECLSSGKVKVYLGVKIEPPAGHDVRLYSRSSISKYNWILSNCVGIGDENYRGEYIAVFDAIPVKTDNIYNLARLGISGDTEIEIEYEDFPYEVGDRCVQMEIRKKDNVELEIVEELSVTERGSKGFGSSGNK